MSYLKLNQLLKKADQHTFEICPHGTCVYEDYLRSEKIDAYAMLNMSNQRENLLSAYDENIDIYIESLRELLQNHKSLNYVVENQPLTFTWLIDGQEFTSTSLFFEYYMANLMRVVNDIGSAMTRKKNTANAIFKQTKDDIIHLAKILPNWKTTHFIQPQPTYVTTAEFLKQLLYFCHATQAMYMAYKDDQSLRTIVALHSASTFYGKMWFRMPVYGTIAQNHYLLSKALCYHEIAKGIEVEEPEKKYALLREVKDLYNLVAFKNCYVQESMKENQKLVEDNDVEIRTLEQVYYVTGSFNIQDIKQPKFLPLKVCQRKNILGCKCK